MTAREPVVWPSMHGTNYTAYLVEEFSPDPAQRNLMKIELVDLSLEFSAESRFQFWVPRDDVIRGERAVAYHVARKMGMPIDRAQT